MKTKGRDTSALLWELRLIVGRKNLAVYNIYVRRAGYGISYAKAADVDTKSDCEMFTHGSTVYHYYPTLRRAVVGEIKMWKGKR